MSPYEVLVELAEREAELLAGGRWDEIVELGLARAELVATLPETPPADAAEALAAAWRTVISSTGAASVAVAETRTALRRLQEGRRAIAGYARSA